MKRAESDKKTLVYISAFTPFGRGESFVLEEGCFVKELHKDFLIIPRNPPKEIFHEKAKDLVENAIWLPLFNFSIAMSFLAALFSPHVWGVMLDIVHHSRTFKIGLKNFAVLPKRLNLLITRGLKITLFR